MDTVGTIAKALGPEMMVCLHKYYSDAKLIDFSRLFLEFILDQASSLWFISIRPTTLICPSGF